MICRQVADYGHQGRGTKGVGEGVVGIYNASEGVVRIQKRKTVH